MYIKSKRGFTLIELLVVIAIIGLLTSIVSVSVSDTQAKARDTKRVEELYQLSLALELYYADHGEYPFWASVGSDEGVCIEEGEGNTNLTFALSKYISSLPKDLKYDSTECGNGISPSDPQCFCFSYKTDGNQKYKVFARMEKENNAAQSDGGAYTEMYEIYSPTLGSNKIAYLGEEEEAPYEYEPAQIQEEVPELPYEYRLTQIQEAILKKGALWKASANRISKMSEEEIKKLLGLKPPTEKLRNEPLREQALTSAEELPDYFDWRKQHGENYITPIKDQGSCGSCWAFGAVAALEGNIKAYFNNPNTSLDLSEQDLVSCFHGRGCEGATEDQVVEIFEDYYPHTGICTESCFPYTAANNDCKNKCGNWQDVSWKTESFYSSPLTVEGIKRSLMENGPLEVGMAVYADFPSYSGGIYQRVSDYLLGYHAVTIVGFGVTDWYDGIEYWIVKNSWGSDWGENGYFRIAVGECGIDSWFALTAVHPLPYEPREVICTDNDKDGYCYWGIGNKPANCPPCDNIIEDCDDSDSTLYEGCGMAGPSGLEFKINSPEKDSFVHGKTELKGTVAGENFQKYELYYWKEDAPGNKILITSSTIPVVNGTFGSWDTTVCSEAPYIWSIEITTKTEGVWEVSRKAVVDNINQPPVFGSFSDKEVSINDLLEFTVPATDPDDPTTPAGTLTYSSPNLPEGAVLDSQTGNFSWTPIEEDFGSNLVTFQVQDNAYTTTKTIEIYVKNIKITQLVAGSFADIWGSRIVYQAGGDIYMYDLNTKEEIQITPTEYALVDSPVIWGARIVWEDYRNTYPDIYIYDLNTEEEIQITNDPQEQVYAEIWENRIVWNEYDHTTKNSYIYMYDLNTKEKIQISHIGTAGLMVFTRPVIWGDKIVWSGWNYETKNYDIYMYDLKTKEEIQITSDSREQLFPDIWGNRIVWQDYRNGQPEIYMYDLTTKEETRITTNLFKQTSPSIYEHWIFWDDHTKGDDDIDIYMYDLNTKEEIQITGAPNQQIYARRWENKIIWQDNRSGSWNIYLAEILPEERRTLTGIITGTGSGKVNVNPPDTDYTTNFTETYYVGTTVALTATPDAGSYFTGWSGDCSSRGSCNLTMDSDKKVIATFDKQVCTDSDGGRNYYLKGITCVGNYCETDFCLYPIELGYDLLNEYYCEGNEINAEIYPCVNGCKNGACFKEKPLTITSPHGGEKWQWGKTYDITWMANQIQEVKIDLYQEGGYYRTLVESWPAERERYSWEISHDIPLADNYQIRISDRENPEIYDKSKGYFGVVLAVYNLQVWLGGPGSGKVIGEGIYCKPDCSEDYFFSTPVHLEAIPDSGSIFEGWSGDCSGNQQGCELRMEADKVVRATFTFGICVGEGETVPVIPSPPECCSGLMLIPPKDPEIVGITGICTAKCGNGVCDTETESSYNCPADCK